MLPKAEHLGVYSLPCWRCAGRGGACATCADPRRPRWPDGTPRGTGRVWFQRCPSALWEPWIAEFLRSLGDLEDGFLPGAGGMSDQPPAWREAVRMAKPHLDTCRKRSAERKERDPRA